jgi:hypothetical protein
LSSISIKGMPISFDTKGCTMGRWLILESCIFNGHHHICWNDTTCKALEIPHVGSLTLIPIYRVSPPMSKYGSYHLISLSYCKWRMLSWFDHIKLRLTCSLVGYHL